MAFTGQGSLDEIDEDKEDPWAKSQFPEEEAATKALDGVRLTPTPAAQKTISRSSFTDVRHVDAGTARGVLPSGTVHAADSRRPDTSVSAATAADDTP